jgi:hypothetical protein
VYFRKAVAVGGYDGYGLFGGGCRVSWLVFLNSEVEDCIVALDAVGVLAYVGAG